MKQIIFAFLCLMLSTFLSEAQQLAFTVIKVNGKVHSTTLKRELKTGDVVAANDKLTFDNRNSYLHVINPTQGRKTFRNVPDNSPREMMLLLEKFTAKDKDRIKSRGGSSSYIAELSEKFTADTILVLGTGTIKIDTTRLSLKQPAGIVAKFKIKNETQEKLISGRGGFALSRNAIFAAADVGSPEVSIRYYEDAKDQQFHPSELIATFVPLYLDERILKSEIEAVVNTMKNTSKSKQQTISSVLDFLSQEYAFVIEENVIDWLSTNKILQ